MNLSLVYLGLTCRYYTLSIYKCQAFIPNKSSLTILQGYSIITTMNKTTDRNIKKQTQLKHTKEKLHQLKDTKSRKKLNLVKSLKKSYEA